MPMPPRSPRLFATGFCDQAFPPAAERGGRPRFLIVPIALTPDYFEDSGHALATGHPCRSDTGTKMGQLLRRHVGTNEELFRA